MGGDVRRIYECGARLSAHRDSVATAQCPDGKWIAAGGDTFGADTTCDLAAACSTLADGACTSPAVKDVAPNSVPPTRA